MKFFKITGIIAIMLFSFYYTDKIATFVLKKNSLYQEIDEIKDSYVTASIPAQIEGDYIIPGLMGKKVNVKDSYYNMKSLEVFNEYYLVYDNVLPSVSIEDNLDKIIVHGNAKKQSISFVVEDEKTLDFLISNNIKSNYLINLETYKDRELVELINNDVKNYDKVESILNNSNLNKNICIINDQIIDKCRSLKKYLIKPIILDNNTFIKVKEELASGNIYLIKKGMNMENIKLLINDAKFKDLNIVYLSELISES